MIRLRVNPPLHLGTVLRRDLAEGDAAGTDDEETSGRNNRE
jgi:hypothetical protein